MTLFVVGLSAFTQWWILSLGIFLKSLSLTLYVRHDSSVRVLIVANIKITQSSSLQFQLLSGVKHEKYLAPPHHQQARFVRCHPAVSNSVSSSGKLEKTWTWTWSWTTGAQTRDSQHGRVWGLWEGRETWCCPVSHCTAGGKLHVLRLQGSALLQHGLPEGAVAQPLQALQAVLVYCSTDCNSMLVSAIENFIK